MSESNVSPDEALLSVARDLNALVVSIDRIGSATADRAPQERALTLLAFFDDWNVFEKLAKARELVSDCVISGASSQDEVARLEALIDAGPIWQHDGA